MVRLQRALSFEICWKHEIMRQDNKRSARDRRMAGDKSINRY